MNGLRMGRKYLEKQSDQDLFGIWQVAKKDTSMEVMVIRCIIEGIWEKRKGKEVRELYKAILALGIEKSFTIDWVSTDRIAVYIDGEYFGIWDTVRKTFVD